MSDIFIRLNILNGGDVEMPLPFLVAWGAISALSSSGLIAGVIGGRKIFKAKKMAEEAQENHQKAIDFTNKERKRVENNVKLYSNKIKSIHDDTFVPVRLFLETLQKNPKSKSIKFPSEVQAQIGPIIDFDSKVITPVQDIAGFVTAVGAGGAASASTTGLVGLLATAGTGTSISSLSGIAAQNATLAWLGGGTLASGGGGIAAGAAVLGGVTVAPALCVTGLIFAKKGHKALTQARDYESKVNVNIEKLKTVRQYLSRITTRINELDNLLEDLNYRALNNFKHLKANTFDFDSDAHMERLQKTLLFVHALSEIIQTPILDKSGNVTRDSESIQIKYKPILEGT
jgi:hypothetical protein